MTKNALWSLILAQNPLMAKGGSMSPAGYKKFFDLVWCEAQKDFMARHPEPGSDPFRGIFTRRASR
jgi:hypothetical protein